MTKNNGDLSRIRSTTLQLSKCNNIPHMTVSSLFLSQERPATAEYISVYHTVSFEVHKLHACIIVIKCGHDCDII